MIVEIYNYAIVHRSSYSTDGHEDSSRIAIFTRKIDKSSIYLQATP